MSIKQKYDNHFSCLRKVKARLPENVVLFSGSIVMVIYLFSLLIHKKVNSLMKHFADDR